MSVALQVSSIFGFHNAKSGRVFQPLDRADMAEGPDFYKRINAINVLGYIPLLCIVTGLGRLIVMQKDMKKEGLHSMRKAIIVRAVFELLFIGITLLVVDIIVSLARHSCGCCPLRDKRGRPQLFAT